MIVTDQPRSTLITALIKTNKRYLTMHLTDSSYNSTSLISTMQRELCVEIICFRDRRGYLEISSWVSINLLEGISMRFVDPRRLVSSTVGVVSRCHARAGGGGLLGRKPRGRDTLGRFGSSGPPLIIPRRFALGRRRRRADLGGDFSRRSGRLVDSQPAVRGRLRGYRNHLTTSSRLGASPRPRAALSPSRDNCPFLDRARLSVRTIARSLTLTVTRCVAFAPVPGVNVVKIRSLIDNSIARAR